MSVSLPLVALSQLGAHGPHSTPCLMAASWHCLRGRRQAAARGPEHSSARLSTSQQVSASARHHFFRGSWLLDASRCLLASAMCEGHSQCCATTRSSLLLHHMLCRLDGTHHETMDPPFRSPQCAVSYQMRTMPSAS